jgi:16S rRNA (uracil1498-N3)-methyltransferase
VCCNGVAAASGAAFVLHASAVTPLARVPLPAPGVAEAPRVVLVVGPDGGIAEEEHGALAQAGATAVRLGPHVMSTSTAGPVAVALLAERLGRRA